MVRQVRKYLRRSAVCAFGVMLLGIGATGVAWAKTDTAAGTVTRLYLQLSGSQFVHTGDSMTVKVEALDASKAVVTDDNSSVTLSDVSGTATSAPVTLSNGVGTGTITFPSASPRDAVLAVAGTVHGKSLLFNVVGPAVQIHVGVTPEGHIRTGTTLTLVVRGEDADKQSVPDYQGPVTITDLSGNLTIVSPMTFTASGLGTAKVMVTQKFRNDQITVTGTGAGSPSGVTPLFSVT